MSTHHKATALRYADQTGSAEANAAIHAELETAAQIERIADQLDACARILSQCAILVEQTVTEGVPSLLGFVSQFIRPVPQDETLPEPNFYPSDKFDPTQN